MHKKLFLLAILVFFNSLYVGVTLGPKRRPTIQTAP